MKHKINHANIKDWAASYDGPLFDAILCDPPYELGFMGKSWDSSGIAFDKDMWADLFKLVKPGGHLLAFSGSRTYHRMAVAIEDAGFEIRDMIEWVYGSGFPKSLNIGKAVDKIQGNEREVTGTQMLGGNAAQSTKEKGGTYASNTNAVGVKPIEVQLTKGTSPYEGYGTALKPAHEPICLARKPLEGTVANNVLKYGTGGLDIDGTRVGVGGGTNCNNRDDNGDCLGHDNNNSLGGGTMRHGSNTQPSGRFPANLIHDGSDEVEAVFPQTKNGGGNSTSKRETWLRQETEPTQYAGDKGSASRFFYTAKASKSERNAGLEGFEEKGIIARNSFKSAERNIDPRSPNGGYEVKHDTTHQNHHPTVKPLSLTKYLANLIKPPTGGRLLVPFSGSGSEMIGALQAGWEYVEGVELTEEYIPIAEARIAHWIKIPIQETLL